MEDNKLDFSKMRVAGWYGPMGHRFEQWALDEGLIVTDCAECETKDDTR